MKKLLSIILLLSFASCSMNGSKSTLGHEESPVGQPPVVQDQLPSSK